MYPPYLDWAASKTLRNLSGSVRGAVILILFLSSFRFPIRSEFHPSVPDSEVPQVIRTFAFPCLGRGRSTEWKVERCKLNELGQRTSWLSVTYYNSTVFSSTSHLPPPPA